MRLVKRFWFSVMIVMILSSMSGCGAMNIFHSKAPTETAPMAPQDDQKLTELEIQVTRLEQELDTHTAQIVDKNRTIQKLKQNIQALETKIQVLESTKKADAKSERKIKYDTPETLYTKARNLLIEDNFPTAAAHFSTFINDHPDHDLADNAVYWLGECYYSDTNYEQAIFVFKNLVKKYPTSEKVPDALLKTGYSYLSLDDSNRAHHYLKLVIKKYPFSPASEKAQGKLGEFE